MQICQSVRLILKKIHTGVRLSRTVTISGMTLFTFIISSVKLLSAEHFHKLLSAEHFAPYELIITTV